MRAVQAAIHRGEDELLAPLTATERSELDRVAARVSALMRDR